MLYTQTSLSLVYNLERVSKNLHCYSATYQFGIVAWLRLEPNSYSTKLYSLHRRCSFGPVAVALGQLSQSFVLSPLFCSWSWSCLCISWIAPWSWWPPNVAVAACWSCSLGWRYGNVVCFFVSKIRFKCLKSISNMNGMVNTLLKVTLSWRNVFS